MSLSKDNSQSDNTYYKGEETFDPLTSSEQANYANLDPVEKAALEEEWRSELTKVEEEISTLRSVLSSKLHQACELKKKLGISVWREFGDNIGQSVFNVTESSAYQMTSETVKTVGEKTTSVLGNITSLGGSVARKLGEVKNFNAFKSFEERVVSASGSLKDRMTGSTSNSTNSFEDALNNNTTNTERRNSQTATPATTPTTIT